MKKKWYILGLLAFATISPLFGQDGLRAAAAGDTAFSKEALEELNSASFSYVRPLIAADGKTLYFSRRSGGRKKDQDIYVVRKDPATGNWGEAEPLGDQLNNKRWNAVASVNPSGKELVLFNTYKGTDNVPLVRTVKENGSWTAPEEIRIQGYENFSPYSDFFVDFKGEVLLMAIEPYESTGEQDLYVSFPEGESGWSEPVNMGSVINSAKADFAPFMGADGRTLFFSSFGHNTQGGSDIFMSVRLDDSWTNWSAPVNLGPVVNTPDDENYFSIDRDFKYMYYTSQKAGEETGADVVRISLPENFTAVNGPVLAKLDSEEIQKIMASGNYEIDPEGRKTNAEGVAFAGWPVEAVPEPAVVDSVAIRAEALAAREEAEGVPARLRGFLPAAEVEWLSAEAADLRNYLQQELPGTDLAIRQRGDTTEFKLVQNILYHFNSIYPQREYFDRLNNIAKVLGKKDHLKIQLIGHTDSIGSAEVNEEVARLRVRNVSRYLEDRRIDRSRIEIVGAGQGEPVAPNETDEGRNMNRRVETIIRFMKQ